MILPDLLTHGLKVVFCGTAAGDKSAERKAYYAGRGNLFYPTLYACGFTRSLLRPEQFPELLNHGIGLTDLAKHTHGMDSKLKDEDFDVMTFVRKIEQYKPRYVCFNGKKAATTFWGLKKTSDVEYGLHRTAIGKTFIYVAPSTAITAQAYWDDIYWHELAKIVNPETATAL